MNSVRTLSILGVALVIGLISGCVDDQSLESTTDREKLLLRELDKHLSTALLQPEGQYLYPVIAKSEGVLESMPLQIEVRRLSDDRPDTVILKTLMLPEELTPTQYWLQIQKNDQWVNYHDFSWQGQGFVGRENPDTDLQHLDIKTLRFFSAQDK